MNCGIGLTCTIEHNPCATPRYGGSGNPFLERYPLPHRSNKNHFINKSVREIIQQSFTSNLDQNLGENMIQVGGRPLFGYPVYYGKHSFPAPMVANNYALLLQY